MTFSDKFEPGAGRTFVQSVENKRVIGAEVEDATARAMQLKKIKTLGAQFIEALHDIGGTDPNHDRFASRDLSLANTHVEDAVMRAVQHITK